MKKKFANIFSFIFFFLLISCRTEPKYGLGVVLNKNFVLNGENISRNVEVTELTVFDKKSGIRTYENLKEPEKNYTEHFEENYYWKEMDSKIVRSEKWETVGTELVQTETVFMDFFGEVDRIWVTFYDAETKIRKKALRKGQAAGYSTEFTEEMAEVYDSLGKNVIHREYSRYLEGELQEKVVTEYDYDEKGQCIRSKQENFLWGKKSVIDVKYEYNEKGHLIRAVSDKGEEAVFYDETNPTSLYGRDENPEELEGYVWSNFYDKIWHKTEEDSGGKYDEKGNLIFAKYEDSEQFFEYDENGNCVYWKEVWNSGKIDERRTEYFDDGEVKREVRTDGDFLVREYNSVNGRHDLIYEKTGEKETFYEYLYDKKGFVIRMTGFTTSDAV